MTELELRNKLVNTIKAWLGYSETNGKFKEIIDLYNTQNPLPVGYKVKYTDEWCAATVTAAGIKAGLQDIILGECSCGRMIALYQKAGRWQENDAYVPQVGDIIMYDWEDNGVGNNTGAPNHVGVVAAVNGTTMTIIEGNKGKAVAYRTMQVNGKFIRGYCLPNYASKATSSSGSSTSTSAGTTTTTATKQVVKASKPAMSFGKGYSGQYIVTANSGLNLRDGAGTNYKVLTTLAKGTVVSNYGYYTKNGSTVWLYIQVTVGNTTYAGFCSAEYLK